MARRHDFNAKKTTSERYLIVGDVVVNSTGEGTLGRVGIVKYLLEPTVVDTHVTILRPNLEINNNYFWFNIALRENEIENLAEGSTGQTELKREYLSDFKILEPAREVQNKFGDLVTSIIHKVGLVEKEQPVLKELSDVCLQRISKV